MSVLPIVKYLQSHSVSFISLNYNMNITFLRETIGVGISVLFLGLAISSIIMWIYSYDVLTHYKHWLWLSIVLFLTGSVVHLLYEYVGFYEWKCNGLRPQINNESNLWLFKKRSNNMEAVQY